MLDMYDFQDDIWLCHSFRGQCFNFTAFVSIPFSPVVWSWFYVLAADHVCMTFKIDLLSWQQPALNTLQEVYTFLSENPTEIVTIIIEDYVHTPKGLSTLFANAGLDKYWYPVSKMPKRGEDWPTVTQMVQDNHRLLVFTSVSSKEVDEGIAYQWRYMVENECKWRPCYVVTTQLHCDQSVIYLLISLQLGILVLSQTLVPTEKSPDH